MMTDQGHTFFEELFCVLALWVWFFLKWSLIGGSLLLIAFIAFVAFG
jgi:hypothetical protein